MKQGFELTITWFDQDILVAIVTCSNGDFTGTTRIYLGHEALTDLASTLQGFPTAPTDTRQAELGTFDPSYAGGGVSLSFSCTDSAGHAVLDIRLRSGDCKAMGEIESVALRLPIEAAGVDAFVDALTRIECTIGAAAFLPLAQT